MVLEHVRRLDGVVVDADQDHVFLVHGQSSPNLIHLSHSDAPLKHSIGGPPPSAKITILKTIFSRSENQHPAAEAAMRGGLTSGYTIRRIAHPGATERRRKCWVSVPDAGLATQTRTAAALPEPATLLWRREEGWRARIVAVGIDQPTESCNSISWK
jgi:hypothetical protein